MKVDRFDFALPPECIAQLPVSPRDAARLLEISPDSIKDKAIRDLPNLLTPGDLLVFNDTRVIPARLKGKRGDAMVEVTLHKHIKDTSWKAFAKPARKLNPGDHFVVAEDFSAEVTEKGEEGEVELRFNTNVQNFHIKLAEHGAMPLPPYIGRKEGSQESDKENYQTMFAKTDGAVAAPTAGLHFTPELMQKLEDKGIKYCFITLHVGAGTFLPVKVEDTDDHKMHSEWYDISEETAAIISDTKKQGSRIVAVGTTSLRSLEAAAKEDGQVQPGAQETDIFIAPGYRFKTADLLLTNFHLPRSTLFMLVCAFAGIDKMHEAYTHAIKGHYRFYSYGDACLLHRDEI